MTEQEMRKGGGSKLSRSETVTVRLDPKLRYLAELAARLHRRTVSSYVEWAIEASLDNAVVKPDFEGRGASIKDDAEYLWDVDEADRFAKLALRYPHLLSHEEQVRWKLIRECGYLWRGRYGPPPLQEWQWRIEEDTLLFDRLREEWELFGAVANGDKPASELPKWSKSNPAPKSSSGTDAFGDDISF
ncbi:MAG: hypothetical protein IOD09_11700 [Rhodocyclaceae bacterium]|jgi:hypothetical protein|nr:hypothetical protein [Rhodocyclaceae bacterium]MCA3128351.1 hypothetical protein [Rhodocyclaceae bacterium]